MTSDLQKWSGGAIYDAETIAVLAVAGDLFCNTKTDVRRWIEGFA